MRIGLIADIHGNLFALTRVLNELEGLNVQQVFSLGDIATLGPWPSEVLTVLGELGIESVMGNTDQWLLEDDSVVVSDIPEMNTISHWASAQLGDRGRSAVAELPNVLQMEFGSEFSLLMFHGSPLSSNDVISEQTPEHEIVQALGDFEANIGAGGHTHLQMIREFESALMVNPGSVGLGGAGPGTPDLPPIRPTTTADFAVLEFSSGEVATELYQLPLDIAAMVGAAETTAMPHVDWWASRWQTSPA